MTTDLEKQFFDTFGIQYEFCSDIHLNPCKFQCDDCEFRTERYPQITDRILLELICICSQYGFCPTVTNIKDLKSKVLKRLFKLKKNLKNNYEHQGCHNNFVRKVQALFKEER